MPFQVIGHASPLIAEQSFEILQQTDGDGFLTLQPIPCLSRTIDHKTLLPQKCIQIAGNRTHEVVRHQMLIMLSDILCVVRRAFKSLLHHIQINVQSIRVVCMLHGLQHKRRNVRVFSLQSTDDSSRQVEIVCVRAAGHFTCHVLNFCQQFRGLFPLLTCEIRQRRAILNCLLCGRIRLAETFNGFQR